MKRKMEFLRTDLEGVFIIEPQIFEDNRGYFFESYSKREFEKNGLYYDFVQDNQSKSSYGTIRGLHFQKGEFAQTKLVRVLEGRVLDVAVDIRFKSPTFGKYIGVELSAQNNKQLLIPRGFAHGFVVLSETAIFSYKCDNFYNKESEGGIIFNDKILNINWAIDLNKALLSEKDLKSQSFEEYTSNPAFIYEKDK